MIVIQRTFMTVFRIVPTTVLWSICLTIKPISMFEILDLSIYKSIGVNGFFSRNHPKHFLGTNVKRTLLLARLQKKYTADSFLSTRI